MSFFEDLQDYPGKTPPKNRPGSPGPKNPITPPEDDVPRWDRNPRIFMVKGVEQEFFTVGALAMALGKKPVTIRAWESNGVIPQASFRAPTPKGEQVPGKAVKGLRLYSRAQVELLIEAARRFGIDTPRGADWTSFSQYVRGGWNSN
jgi:hypothetical protein